MKEKNGYWILYILAIIGHVTGIGILYIFNQLDYIIVLIPTLIYLILSFIVYLKYVFSTEQEKYEKIIKKIIRIYKTILVEIDEFPTLKNKSFITVKSLDDMITAQIEVRNPIFYIKKEKVTIFYLFNNDVILTYMIRVKEEENTSLEETIIMEKIEQKEIEAL